MIYLIECVGTHLAKIGFSESSEGISRRLKNLQVGSPHPLRLLAAVEGTRADEKSLHKQFAFSRRHGDWFRLTSAIEEHFGLIFKCDLCGRNIESNAVKVRRHYSNEHAGKAMPLACYIGADDRLNAALFTHQQSIAPPQSSEAA